MANREGTARPLVQDENSTAIHSRYGAGWRSHAQEQYVSTAIDANYFKGVDKHGQRTIDWRGLNRNQDQPIVLHNIYGGFNEKEPRVFTDECPTIRTPKGGGHLPVIIDKRLNSKNKDIASSLCGGAHSDCLSNVQKDNWLIQPARNIRRLTPTECERLQGFPDGWTKDGLTKDGGQAAISDTQRYKCLGNAVTTNVVSAIGVAIIQHTDRDKLKDATGKEKRI